MLLPDWRRLVRRAWSQSRKDEGMEYAVGEGMPSGPLSVEARRLGEENYRAVKQLPANGLVHLSQYPVVADTSKKRVPVRRCDELGLA